MTGQGKGLLQGVIPRVQGVLEDASWILTAAVLLGLLAGGLWVLAAATMRLLLELLWGTSATLPDLLVLPARYLSAWVPTWLVVPIMAVGSLAAMSGFLTAWRALSQARLRRLTVALAACVNVGIPPTLKLHRWIKRAIRWQAAHATEAIMAGVQDTAALRRARLWIDAELALDAGDHQAVAAVLAQLAPPSSPT